MTGGAWGAPRPLGRPNKRTPARREIVVAAFRGGASKRAAAAAAMMGVEALSAWIADDPGLAEEIEIARGQHELDLLEKVREAAEDPKHWTAAAWSLERMYQERYALKGARSPLDQGSGAERIPQQVAILIQQVLVQRELSGGAATGAPLFGGVGAQVLDVDQAPVGRVIDADPPVATEPPDRGPVEPGGPE